MSSSNLLDLRNRLCLERIKIETEQLPYAHSPERRQALQVRLQQIEHEIKQTYEPENQPDSHGAAG